MNGIWSERIWEQHTVRSLEEQCPQYVCYVPLLLLGRYIYTLGVNPLAIPTLPSCADGLPHLIFFMLTALLKFEWDLIIEGVKFSFVLFCFVFQNGWDCSLVPKH